MDTNGKSRQRGENWTKEEKDLFLKIISNSASIIECKLTDSNTNKRKHQEWEKIQNKLLKLTGKQRDISQIKGIWRRMKTEAKKNGDPLRDSKAAGGDSPSQPPNDDELKIINMLCPSDFLEETNKNDSDGNFNVLYDTNDTDNYEDADVNTNLEFKKRRLSQVEEEHTLKLQYLKQELVHQERKHRLEIELLTNKSLESKQGLAYQERKYMLELELLELDKEIKLTQLQKTYKLEEKD